MYGYITSKYVGDYFFARFLSYHFVINALECPPRPLFCFVFHVVVVRLNAIPAICVSSISFIGDPWPRIQSGHF